MIRLNCLFKADNSDDYKKALRAAVTLTDCSRKHEGNISYDTFQSATHTTVFMICETWADDNALDKHSATPEFAKYVAIMKECGELTIERFTL